MFCRRSFIISALAAAVLGRAAHADDDDDDDDRARDAVRAGEIRPLGEILAAVEREFVGEVVKVELDRDDGRWIYEIRLLTRRGAVLKLVYDARHAVLIGAEGRDIETARRRR